MQLSKLTPIEAIRNGTGLKLKKGKRSPLLSLLFGVEGEIAGSALNAQKKALHIATLSLLLSFLGFTMVLCFATLSSISTRHTYFERYQDCWDMMVTVKETDIVDFKQTDKLRHLTGLADVTVYQKATATLFLPERAQSNELLALGGYEAVTGQAPENGSFQVAVPVVILDLKFYLKL